MLQFEGGNLVDLSHPLADGDVAYPGDPGVNYRTVHTCDENGYHVSLIEMGSHVGTHLDAPRHIDDSGRTVEALDLGKLVGPATVVEVDLSAADTITRSNIDVDPSDLPRGARLLFRTGWGARWRTDGFFDDFPGLDLDLAEALATAGVSLIGLEQPSVHPTLHKEVHAVLLGDEIVVIEAMASLDRLQSKEIFLMCLPLPHVGLDGAAVRALAWDPAGAAF
jgi:kynurenine formamidase